MEPTYRIHIASEMTGVSEALIRAWERRYGVLKPQRTRSRYRAYTAADIEILKRLKQLTEDGVAIGEAVRLLPQIKKEVKDQRFASESGGKAPHPAQLLKWQGEVLAAAQRFDQQAIEAVLDEAMASLPPVAFCEEVLMPLQREVGERWHEGTLSVAEEHLVTQAARQRLVALLHQAPKRSRAHVVCACMPDEDHELGLLGAALGFRHAGWRVTFLGARTPLEQMVRVVRASKPNLLALSALTQSAENLQSTLMELMERLPPHTKVVLGGAAARRLKSSLKTLGLKVISSSAEWEETLSLRGFEERAK